MSVEIPQQTAATENNDDPLQFHEDTQAVSDIEDTIEADDDGPFSWQKNIVVPCDKEEVTNHQIDDDVLMYDPEPYCSHAVQDTFSKETDEVLEELKCNLCGNIIKGGFRYSCVQCPDFDLCGACEANGAHRMHYVLRSPGTKDVSEVQLMLRRIRQTLLTDSVVSLRDHPGELKDEVKEEIEEGPQPGIEDDDPLSDHEAAEMTSQELNLEECSDTESMESEEDEPPQKRTALSPLQSLETSTTFTHETTLRSTAKENRILLEINPQEQQKKYLPVPNETKKTPINTPIQQLIVNDIPKEKSLPLTGLLQHNNSETRVSIHTFTGKRVLLPSNIIDQDNTNIIDPKKVQLVVKETKSEQLRIINLNPSVRIERLDVHTLNKY
ncbi:uncharacterized protein LOC113228211 [Hyposmocoma kahamanoa]|uniref:uncharacterized protein LOC113228211 n=1 Tax=Hyposmocoma kahamanoa TaxID=1477025 RepID=UPI000E6D8C0C|nr:uncharacterized protein LOC113228211 [Hyposmocoma kahamanoa]